MQAAKIAYTRDNLLFAKSAYKKPIRAAKAAYIKIPQKKNAAHISFFKQKYIKNSGDIILNSFIPLIITYNYYIICMYRYVYT